jgi:hypothetical protein
MCDKLQGSSMQKRDTTQVPAGALLSNCQRRQASKQAADDAVPNLLLTLTAHRTWQHKDSYHHQGQHVTAQITANTMHSQHILDSAASCLLNLTGLVET